jgi:hypothetical protein
MTVDEARRILLLTLPAPLAWARSFARAAGEPSQTPLTTIQQKWLASFRRVKFADERPDGERRPWTA